MIVMGASQLRALEGNNNDDTDLAAKNITAIYWKMDSDLAYKVTVKLHEEQPDIVRYPAAESLYSFAMRYTVKWRLCHNLEKKLPNVHLTSE